ncbi:PREDICTED: lysine-rich nucleolar protein 1-like [Acropora digitifera]|uniref:lysine-rich nucleolar protein 1-like n=1 Tax=Acropora digitifera TaxID=70779 RepID=UPI00077AC11A|nr:PREDICTED: lysine-rich nucleolar protein 1-like [Acropora digitifera]
MGCLDAEHESKNKDGGGKARKKETNSKEEDGKEIKTGESEEGERKRDRRKAKKGDLEGKKDEQKEESQPKLGQWSEAEFGSPERKDKFLRLMGAFKNPSTQGSGADNLSSVRRCMTRGTEESLTQRLQQQYETAMDSSRKKRGLGLGYNPDVDPANKLFYIDKSASASVKF